MITQPAPGRPPDASRSRHRLPVPPLPRLEVELRVAHRLARQSVVLGNNAVPYTGIIHEAALRMQLGGRSTAQVQLLSLLEATERPQVSLLVIPFTAGGFALLDSSVLYAEAHNSHLDTVQMDAPTGAVFVDSPTQLANFRRRLDLAEQVALTPAKSRDFINAVAKEL